MDSGDEEDSDQLVECTCLRWCKGSRLISQRSWRRHRNECIKDANLTQEERADLLDNPPQYKKPLKRRRVASYRVCSLLT